MWRIFGHYISKLLLFTIVGDLVVLLGSVVLVRGWAGAMAERAISPKITLFVAVTMMLFYLADLYDGDVRYRRGELCLRAGLASLIAAGLMAAIGYGLPGLAFSRSRVPLDGEPCHAWAECLPHHHRRSECP